MNADSSNECFGDKNLLNIVLEDPNIVPNPIIQCILPVFVQIRAIPKLIPSFGN